MLQRFATARIMVIDDNEANIALLRALLQRAGLYHIFTFSDPRLAVTSMDQVNPDMVMLDLHMPHLDGFEVLEAITQHAAGSYLPVLVLTADSTQEAAHKASAWEPVTSSRSRSTRVKSSCEFEIFSKPRPSTRPFVATTDACGINSTCITQ